ncbi:MAG: hypothetical protein ACYDHE_04925 [Candidatus Acidiferrales bacterium]
MRYKARLDPYLSVIGGPTILLTGQQMAVNFHIPQMLASVLLIKALGGGWEVAKIPASKDLSGTASRAKSMARADFK